MDLSYIDWPSFRSGLVVGLGVWAIVTVLRSGWTTIEPADDRFDIFDDEPDVCLMCRLDTHGVHPHGGR